MLPALHPSPSQASRLLPPLLLCLWAARGERQHAEQLLEQPVDLDDWADTGVDDWADGETEVRGAPHIPNTDRLTCLRQDDLDLVKPLEKRHSIRMVIPVGQDSTKDDVYLSVDNLWLKRVSLVVTLKRRKGRNTFMFEVTGDDSYEGHRGVAGVDFWLNGVDILIRNAWMDWGSGFVADRERLNKGQDGQLKLKLSGEGKAVWNDEIGQYEIELISQNTEPFHLEIENQWILEKVVNKFGNLDDVIMKNLWSAVAKAIPISFAASLTSLNSSELWTEIHAKVSGSQPSFHKPLELDVQADVTWDTQIGRMLAVYLENFDATAVAENKMRKLLKMYDLQEMWTANKDTLAGVLKRYGVNVTSFEEGLNITDIESQLVTAAKNSADFVVQALKPFIKASKAGGEDFFEGVRVALGTNVGWDSTVDDGRMKLRLSTPDGGSAESKAVELPKRFLDVLGVGVSEAGGFGDLLVAPPAGTPDAVIAVNGLAYSGGELELGSIQIQNVRLRAEPGQQGKAYKLGGKIRDLAIVLPPAFQPAWEATWPTSEVRLRDSGDIQMDLGRGGLDLSEIAPQLDATVPDPQVAWPRRGNSTDLDGPVPKELARPTQAATDISLAARAPLVSSDAAVRLAGEKGRLGLKVTASAKVTVDLDVTLKPVLAPRPSQDFGYVFYVGEFRRELQDGESGVDPVSNIVAVVSCGHLRLVIPRKFGKDKANPFTAIDFAPGKGQLQLELEKYLRSPDVVEKSPQDACLKLYSGGYKPRSVSQGFFYGSKEVDDRLCGPTEKVEALRHAIDLQRHRFSSNGQKSRAWNFGTHLVQDEDGVEQPQYLLAPGRETQPLSELIWKASGYR